jgi:hypothetical protein
MDALNRGRSETRAKHPCGYTGSGCRLEDLLGGTRSRTPRSKQCRLRKAWAGPFGASGSINIVQVHASYTLLWLSQAPGALCHEQN